MQSMFDEAQTGGPSSHVDSHCNDHNLFEFQRSASLQLPSDTSLLLSNLGQVLNLTVEVLNFEKLNLKSNVSYDSFLATFCS